MSRHRNIKSLTDDDLYDYQDDGYDDYYYDDEYDDCYCEKISPSQATGTTKLKTKNSSSNPQVKSAKSSKEAPRQTSVSTTNRARIKSTASSLKVNSTKSPKALSLPGTKNNATVARDGNESLNKSNLSTVPEYYRIDSSRDDGMRLNVKSPDATKSTKSIMKKIPLELQQRLKSQKSRLTMVILGHVDAGKSTLMGQVLLQMGVVEERIVNKYQKKASEIGKASFALAWIMDEDELERERGVTIDIATKHISTAAHDLTVLDAPGHADYVPAMITGAGISDVGILVVSSTKGEFESGFDSASQSGCLRGHVGQTREHITLARGLGVSQLIVAVNKLDAANPAWSKIRFEEIQSRLKPFLKTNGFNLQRVQFIPLSGLTGVNITKSPESGHLAAWYNGKTLLNAINSFQQAKRNIDKPFRFIISDLYLEGKGIVLKGRVVQGLICVGDQVSVLPIGDDAVVHRILPSVAKPQSEHYDDDRTVVAIAGDTIDIILTGVDIARISVGNIVSEAAKCFRPSIKKKFQAKIIVMEGISIPIICGSQVLMHMHCLDAPAVVNRIVSKYENGMMISNPRILNGGSTAVVDIKLCEKICLETFQNCRALGRFALRRGGDTIAVGVIENI